MDKTELNEILEQQSLWPKTLGKKGKRADLSGADLRGADLRRANLYNAGLFNANLKKANFRKANLKESNLIEADLSKSNLSEADLSEAYLCFADLRNANLRSSNLNKSNLSNTYLNYANLSEADLRRVYFVETDLSNANLSGADLREANLNYTKLSGANLSNAMLIGAILKDVFLEKTNFKGAKLLGTTFINVDFRKAKGLDTVEHHSPSTIGTNTIKNSNGQIPEVFLRGCGLEDWEIEQAKLYREGLTDSQITDIAYNVVRLRGLSPIKYFSCFISYSHANKEFASKLYDTLQGKGIRCWLDKHEMLPGDEIYEKVDRGIQMSDKVLLCCSKESLTSWWVDNEINSAFEKERQLKKKSKENVLALIPLDLDGYLLNGWESGKKNIVCSRFAADFKGWVNDGGKFDKEVEKVIRALRPELGGGGNDG